MCDLKNEELFRISAGGTDKGVTSAGTTLRASSHNNTASLVGSAAGADGGRKEIEGKATSVTLDNGCCLGDADFCSL
jgi:hypothetical protein